MLLLLPFSWLFFLCREGHVFQTTSLSLKSWKNMLSCCFCVCVYKIVKSCFFILSIYIYCRYINANTAHIDGVDCCCCYSSNKFFFFYFISFSFGLYSLVDISQWCTWLEWVNDVWNLSTFDDQAWNEPI